METELKPQVIRTGALDMQVCIPIEWTDEQVREFANAENLCGTANGWCIRRESDKALLGSPERNHCTGREGYVHVMLDA